MTKQPNILFFHVDNLGMGELGCYGGGILRGADTKRIDTFAKEGMKLTHYVVEPQCTPTRSALMTGRYPIRSGNHTIALGGNAGGIVKWEVTIAELLAQAGYTSSILGKWHIGAEDGRFPTDHGFDEWYGPLRTYDECMWLEDPHYVPERDGYSHMHEGKKGKGCKPLLDEQHAAFGSLADFLDVVVDVAGHVDGDFEGRTLLLNRFCPTGSIIKNRDVSAQKFRRVVGSRKALTRQKVRRSALVAVLVAGVDQPVAHGDGAGAGHPAVGTAGGKFCVVGHYISE